MFLPKKSWIICRVCLEQRDGLHDIFKKISSFNIWLSLRDCCGVPVRKDDNLPDKICEQCLIKLWESYKFRLKCQRGHREITHMLSERNYNIYEQELEEERRASSDILKPSVIKPDLEVPIKNDTNTNISRLVDKNQQTILKTSNITEFPDKEGITIKTATRKRIKPEKTQTIKIVDGRIKHYCIVNRKEIVKDEGKDKDDSFENAEQKRIILLLKLKNATNTKNKLQTEKKTKCVKKPKTQSAVKPKTEQKTILKTQTKTNKNKLCKTQNNFACKLCKKTYDTYQHLRHHIYTHNNPYQCKCVICGKVLATIKILRGHLQSKH